MWLQFATLLGAFYFVVFVVVVEIAMDLVFVWMGTRLLRRPSSPAPWSLFKYSGVYLSLLFVAVMIDSILK